MKFIMLACNPNKVRLRATHCVIRQFVGNVYHFNSYKVKFTTSHCVIRQFVGNVYHFNSHKVKLATSHCLRQFVGNVKSFQLVQGKDYYITVFYDSLLVMYIMSTHTR